MYIFAVHLENFRSHHDLWVFPNESVNVIVGPNNCGKTSFLEATALVLDPRIDPWRSQIVTRFDFHNLHLDRPIEITAWLKPSTVTTEQGCQYTDSTDVITAFYDKLSEWTVETGNPSPDNGDPGTHPKKLVPMVAEPMAETLPDHERLLAIRLRATWDSLRDIAETEVNVIDQMDNSRATLTRKLREMLGFTLLPTDRDPLKELSLSRNSVLARALDEEEVLQALRKLFLILEQEKQPLVEQASVATLLQSLEGLVAPRFFGGHMDSPQARLTLTFLNGELWRLRGATSIATSMPIDSDRELSLPLRHQGRGAQNLLLLLHVVEMLRSHGSSSIIALEEPEQNLEPSLARCVFGELCSLVRVQGVTQTGQIFVTTHSPSLVSELTGPDSLLIFADTALADEDRLASTTWRVISGRWLSQSARKRLDQRRERYVNTLFARQVLIVEGDSEIGFLPVAFRYSSRGKPYENPYHLGLEVLNGDSKSQAPCHAKALRHYGRSCHLLLDYDGPDPSFDRRLRSRYEGSVDFVTCWPQANPLPFVKSCDLEVILAAYTPPPALFRAIKGAYRDAGHPLRQRDWEDACGKLDDQSIVERFPDVYDDFDLEGVALEVIGGEETQRAFLYTLLHGPHCCKSVKDMRLIATELAKHDALPGIVDDLRRRVLTSMLQPREIDCDQPYLATPV